MTKVSKIIKELNGIKIETLDIKPTDTIILKFDTDIYDLDEIQSIFNYFNEVFPSTNTMIGLLKGVDIEVHSKKEGGK